MNENNGISLGEKIAFIISFIAILIALYSFNTQLRNINLNFLIIGTYSLDTILLYFTLIMGISLYFYALNCIRFDFPYLLNIKILKYLEMGGRVFYFLAIFVYPISLLFLLIINYTIIWIAQYVTVSIQISLPKEATEIMFLIAVIISFLFTYKQTRDITSIFIERKEEKEENASLKANYDFDNKKYNYVPIHLYERIIERLEGKLVKEYGYSISNISNSRLINLALERKMITQKDYAFIQNLRELRNSFAHAYNGHDLEKQMAKTLIERTNAIIKRL